MPNTRLATLGVVVVAFAVLQILFEDVLVFLGTTGGGSTPLGDSPFLLVAVPLTLSVALLVILVGGALLSAESLR